VLARLSLLRLSDARVRSVSEQSDGGAAKRVRVMKHKNSHLLVGYWSRLRKDGTLPDQTDIDPRAIKRMLPYVFILDVAETHRPVYRLAGTALCERFGFELKGTGFLSHWEAQSALAVTSLLRQALRLGQPLCLTSIGASADCGMVEVETVLAPVTFGSEGPTRFIGQLQILTDVTQLGGRPIAFQRLIGSQMIDENEPVAPPDIAMQPLTVLHRHPRAPHLRLVVSHD
jgi:hypothetical protein